MFEEIRNADRTLLIIAGAVFILAMITYVDTMAPTVSFWDCGEYIATAYTMAVPHPPGAPFFILLGRFFTMLPFGDDIGFRMNMLSAVSSAGTVLFLFLIIVKFINQYRGKVENSFDKVVTYGGAVIGSLAFAWSDSFWFNAVEAEVYALSALSTAVVVWLALHWLERADRPGNERYLLLIAYMMGLAMGVHLLNLLALPMIALIVYFRKFPVNVKTFIGVVVVTGFSFLIIYLGILKGIPKIAAITSFTPVLIGFLLLFVIAYWAINSGRKLISLSLLAGILVIIGYSTYTTVVIRAGANPNINENNPNSPARLYSYLNREQYGDAPIFDRKRWKPEAASKYTGEWDYFWNYQIKHMYVRYFNWQFIGREVSQVSWRQFYAIPFLLGLFGAFYHYLRDRQQAFNIFVLFFMTGLAIILYLNQEDPQPRERDYSFIGSFMAFSMWIGIGAAGVLESTRELMYSEKLKKYGTIAIAVLLFFIVPLNMAVGNWHVHDRSGNYIAWDYSYNILATVEPDGIIFTNGDNDTFPLWYLQEVEKIRTDVRVVNLSLLNTPWYIKQLRDIEPKVNINLTDDQVDRLFLSQWPKEGQIVEIPGPPDSVGAPTTLRWNVPPTYNRQGITAVRVQDLMILHILDLNRWKKPIYFAVTVSPSNKIGLESHLRMDGLAFRVTPNNMASQSADGIANPLLAVELVIPGKIEDNLFNKYRFTNLNDPDVYYNVNTLKLLQNYRTAYIQLAWKYLNAGQPEKLPGVLASMEETMPESIIPLVRREAILQIGFLEKEAGFPEKLRARLDKLMEETNVSPMNRLVYGSYYMRDLGDYDTAEEIFLQLRIEDPNNGRVVGMLVATYEESQNWAGGIKLLEEWIRFNPGDPGASTKLREFQSNMDSSTVN